jgi:hypothetical protein
MLSLLAVNAKCEGDRASQAGSAGPAAFRLCNLIAQSPSDAEARLQEGGSRRNSRGRETEPGEIIYFKLYQSQLPVIE